MIWTNKNIELPKAVGKLDYNMTQLTDEHFELHTKNKAEQHERQKIKFLEDRIKTLETAIESHAKILARFQMTEGDNS